jgi:hypothetical protein
MCPICRRTRQSVRNRLRMGPVGAAAVLSQRRFLEALQIIELSMLDQGSHPLQRIKLEGIEIAPGRL